MQLPPLKANLRRAVLAAAMALVAGAGAVRAATTLIERGRATEWHYLDDGQRAQADWMGADFDDHNWRVGKAPLGFGEPDVTTLVRYGGNEAAKAITTYFRTEFRVDDLSSIGEARSFIRVDDGAVIYLNGRDIARINMPEGRITPATLASQQIGGALEQVYYEVVLPREILRAGRNTLAVEVHQGDAGSSDLFLDVRVRAYAPGEAPAPEDNPHPAMDGREADMRRAFAELSASLRAGHGEFRFRPGSRCEGEARRVAPLVERELARLCALLEVDEDVRYVIFFFDSDAEMQAALKLPEQVGGITNGHTVAIACDNDRGTMHELIHVIANAKIGAGSALLAEGLADGLLSPAYRAHPQAFPKYFRMKGQLAGFPRDILGATDLMAWTTAHRNQGFRHPYALAASWVRFLFDAHGAAKLKQYYQDQPLDTVYAGGIAALEKEWLAAVDAYAATAEELALVGTECAGIETPLTMLVGQRWALQGRRGPESRTFQWRKNGKLLPDFTGPKLTIARLVPSDAGIYEVTLRDAPNAAPVSHQWELVVVEPARSER